MAEDVNLPSVRYLIHRKAEARVIEQKIRLDYRSGISSVMTSSSEESWKERRNDLSRRILFSCSSVITVSGEMRLTKISFRIVFELNAINIE